MPEKKNLTISISTFQSLNELSPQEKQLAELAQSKLPNAYAPYSNFEVSCAVLLEDGSMHFGTNQENASYPVGSCAEQVAMKYVSSNFPHLKITTIALVAAPKDSDSKGVASPCGMCRQTLLEYELKQKSPYRIILFDKKGSGVILESAKDLLPLHFEPELL